MTTQQKYQNMKHAQLRNQHGALRNTSLSAYYLIGDQMTRFEPARNNSYPTDNYFLFFDKLTILISGMALWILFTKISGLI